MTTNAQQEARIDEALKESFPASDPPSFIGAGAPPGTPPARKRRPGDWGRTSALLSSAIQRGFFTAVNKDVGVRSLR
jgi:hypothetical protein